MKLKFSAILAALLAGLATSHADITNTTFQAYNDGVMYCTFDNLTQIGPGDFHQSFYGDQLLFGTGTIYGQILADPTDPNLTLAHTIDNDTGVTWTDYHVDVTMSQIFSFTNVTVGGSWSQVVTAPTLVSGSYVGSIDFYAAPFGAPVPNGGILNFSYTLTFSGSVSFSEQLTPSSTPVPEPGTFALVACGLMGLLVLQRRKIA